MTGYNATEQVRDTAGNVVSQTQTVAGGQTVHQPPTTPHAATDDAVAQAVDRARRKDDTRTRLNRLAANLRDMQVAYNTAYRTWSTAGSPLKSPTYDQRRSGKPGSRTPTEAEGRTRVALVLAAQRIAMSLRILAKHNWLHVNVWHPESLQRHYVVIRDPWVAVPAFDDGEPAWRDASDLDVEPPDVTQGVSQLRGAVATLQAQDWDEADQADRDTVADFLHEAEEAVNHVNRTGAWFRGMPTDETILCKRDNCWNEVKGRAGGVCVSCTSREYRQRKQAS